MTVTAQTLVRAALSGFVVMFLGMGLWVGAELLAGYVASPAGRSFGAIFGGAIAAAIFVPLLSSVFLVPAAAVATGLFVVLFGLGLRDRRFVALASILVFAAAFAGGSIFIGLISGEGALAFLSETAEETEDMEMPASFGDYLLTAITVAMAGWIGAWLGDKVTGSGASAA